MFLSTTGASKCQRTMLSQDTLKGYLNGSKMLKSLSAHQCYSSSSQNQNCPLHNYKNSLLFKTVSKYTEHYTERQFLILSLSLKTTCNNPILPFLGFEHNYYSERQDLYR